MEAKEKADELVEKYRKVESLKDFEGMDNNLAIECAIIAVQEIISTIKIDYMRVQNRMQTVAYWQEVKRELELMQ